MVCASCEEPLNELCRACEDRGPGLTSASRARQPATIVSADYAPRRAGTHRRQASTMEVSVTHEDVLRALSSVKDPELQRDIVDLGMVRDVVSDDRRIGATIVLTTAGCPLRNQIRADAEQALTAIAGGRSVEVKLDAMSCEERDALTGTPAAAGPTRAISLRPWLAHAHHRRRQRQGRRRQEHGHGEPCDRARRSRQRRRTDRRGRLRPHGPSDDGARRGTAGDP